MSTFKDFMDSELAATAVESQNELIRKAYANRKSVQMLNVDALVPSQYNSGRSMDDNYVSAVADSIEAYGTLIEPITVYPLGDGTYSILSGHVRTAAWKQLQERYPEAWGRKQIPCLIVDKPESELAEVESLSKANVHRTNKEDRNNEIVIANNAWSKYIEPYPAIKAKYVTKYEKLFDEANKNNPKYIRDPDKVKRSRFRPRIWYIREQTGIELTDRMITTILSSANKDELMRTVRKSDKERKITKVTSVKLQKKLDAFLPSLERYFEQEDKDFDKDPNEREILLSNLKDMAAYISEKISELNFKNN